jgi:NADPH2:quinone reductase
MSRTASMRVLVLEAANGPLVSRHLPRPVPGPGQLLVEIAASGVNPLDTKIRAGAAAHAKHPLPAVLGMDLAGVVRAVGAGVDRFRVGDEVYGMTGGVGGLQGSLAEYAAVDARTCWPASPANLSMREAAALPLVGDHRLGGPGRPGPHPRRARPGAGARRRRRRRPRGRADRQGLGARVFATGTRRRRLDTGPRASAPTPIDYATTQPWTTTWRQHTGGEGFDVIYDTVGGATLDASFRAARKLGRPRGELRWAGARMRWRRCRCKRGHLLGACSRCCPC